LRHRSKAIGDGTSAVRTTNASIGTAAAVPSLTSLRNPKALRLGSAWRLWSCSAAGREQGEHDLAIVPQATRRYCHCCGQTLAPTRAE